MASPSSDAAISAISSVLATATAGVVTSEYATRTHGFRAPSNVMASIPRFFAKMASLGYVGTEVDPTVISTPVPAAAEAFTTSATSALASQLSGNATAGTLPPGAFDGGLRSVGNVFSYVTSRWAVLCLFMTVLLNRTPIYASLRRPIRLPFKARLVMRIVPVAMLALQISHMMFAMRCQTSTIFQGERTESAWQGSYLFLHAVGKTGSFWLDDRAVCERIGMIPDSEWIERASSIGDPENPEIEISPPKGSLDILWPLYKTLSFSQFVEVFTCSLVVWEPFETGMTLLEHSLAFAEAEALATRKTYRLETSRDEEGQESKVFKVKGEKLVPAEVLYISIISSLSHVTFHTMAIFNRRTRYRLLASGFYGLAFLGGFAVALFFGGTAGILDFPTVSVVGFIPHLLILAGITVCASIYGLALLLSSLFPPSGRREFTGGFNNLRANLTLSSASISLTEDFYSVLLKMGYMCLTAAAEATYLNEGRAVRIPGWTWLERERARVLDSRLRSSGNIASQYSQTAKGTGPFAQERREFKGVVESAKDKRRGSSGRWIGAGEILRGVGVVLGRWGIVGTSRLLGRAHPTPEPATLLQDADDDSCLYERFLAGSSLPETDESADYAPSVDSDEDGYESSCSLDADDEYTHAPRCGHREATPLLDPTRLAALLDPQTPEDRASARILAHHLTSSHALTRRQYTSLHVSGAAEENALENILLSRRQERAEEDEGEETRGGPVCVVCQSEPRTVIVWPCRCLSLCEDCRVCLAMNNWSNCVTCRAPSIGYSRVYVP